MSGKTTPIEQAQIRALLSTHKWMAKQVCEAYDVSRSSISRFNRMEGVTEESDARLLTPEFREVAEKKNFEELKNFVATGRIRLEGEAPKKKRKRQSTAAGSDLPPNGTTSLMAGGHKSKPTIDDSDEEPSESPQPSPLPPVPAVTETIVTQLVKTPKPKKDKEHRHKKEKDKEKAEQLQAASLAPVPVLVMSAPPIAAMEEDHDQINTSEGEAPPPPPPPKKRKVKSDKPKPREVEVSSVHPAKTAAVATDPSPSKAFIQAFLINTKPRSFAQCASAFEAQGLTTEEDLRDMAKLSEEGQQRFLKFIGSKSGLTLFEQIMLGDAIRRWARERGYLEEE